MSYNFNFASKDELDALEARIAALEAQPGRLGKCIYTELSFFGPLPGKGIDMQPIGPDWKFLTAVTASTAFIPFVFGLGEVKYAHWQVVWTPNNTALHTKLIAFDWTERGQIFGQQDLAIIQSNGNMTPANQSLVVTSKLNSLVDAKLSKQLGVLYKDDGHNGWTLFENSLELTFQV